MLTKCVPCDNCKCCTCFWYMHNRAYVGLWTEPLILFFQKLVSKHSSKIYACVSKGRHTCFFTTLFFFRIIYNLIKDHCCRIEMLPQRRVSPSFNGIPIFAMRECSVKLDNRWSSVMLISFSLILPTEEQFHQLKKMDSWSDNIVWKVNQ